ncbi:MAG: DUF2314 domain-containing protein [Phycisphaeraceae bacterium]|nr:DUF2314 domain-containing protein [Phycisphaeraceae bacterium]
MKRVMFAVDRGLVLSACVIVAACVLSGCDRAPAKERASIGDEPKDPNASLVSGGEQRDPRLVAAAEEARRRWPEFVDAFSQREPNVAYAVKLPFAVRGGGHEYMWIQVTLIDGDKIEGTLNNHPTQDVGVKEGDPVRGNVDDVYDWLIGRGRDNITGAFSLRALEEMQKEREARGR